MDNLKKCKRSLSLNPLFSAEGTEDSLVFETQPFKHWKVIDFISSTSDFEELLEEINELEFTRKVNDLFSLEQTMDLASATSPVIAALCEALKGCVRSWASKAIGCELNTKLDMHCARYSFTDHLLCHDDLLDSRKVAFMIYLVPSDWCEEDGGSLELFDTFVDKSGTVAPNSDPVKTLSPMRNSFLMFEVSQHSFHRVAEVLTKTKSRLAFSGWFHSETATSKQPLFEKRFSHTFIPAVPSNDDILLRKFVNPVYFSTEVQREIREEFCETSEIQIANFLKEDIFDAISDSLKTATWKTLNLPHMTKYFEFDDQLEVIDELYRLFQSEIIFALLTRLTGLELDEDVTLSDDDDDDECPVNGDVKKEDPTSKISAKAHIRLSQWSHSCFSLLQHDSMSSVDRLHCRLSFLDYHEDHGGGDLIFIDNESGKELVRLVPPKNSLSLVYVEQGVASFVKYLNVKSCKHPLSFLDAIYLETSS